MKPLSIKAVVYLRAAELVEMGHCKGAMAVDKDGSVVASRSSNAVAWCMIGAVNKAYHEIGLHHENVRDLDANWNDLPDTTPQMVAARLREEAFKD